MRLIGLYTDARAPNRTWSAKSRGKFGAGCLCIWLNIRQRTGCRVMAGGFLVSDYFPKSGHYLAAELSAEVLNVLRTADSHESEFLLNLVETIIDLSQIPKTEQPAGTLGRFA